MPRMMCSGCPRSRAQLLGPRLRLRCPGQGVQLVEVDADRVVAGVDGAIVLGPDRVALGPKPQQRAAEPDEVGGGTRSLEADEVRAEQTLHHLSSPRESLEQLGGWERDVQEESDPQVGPALAQHLRHELQLVVVHPHGGVEVRVLGGCFREAGVHGLVGVPPGPVVLRRRDDVVVERPQRGIGEALVVLLDLLCGQGDRHHVDAVGGERLDDLGIRIARAPVPADPRTGLAAHDRLERGDEPAGRPLPTGGAVGCLDPVHRQAVGDDDEVVHAGPPVDRSRG